MRPIIKKLRYRRAISLILALALVFGAFCFSGQTVEAKGSLSPGDSVKNVLVYVMNDQGQQVLVSQLSVSDMLEYLNDNFESYGAVHNYSILDNFVTPVHQEAQGFTVEEMMAYAQDNSTLEGLELTFAGNDSIAFWEIDGNQFDMADTYTWNSLYGTDRYNFPELYGEWDYASTTPRYKNFGAIWAGRQEETPLLSITAFSQRYFLTTEKVNSGNYNMEGYFNDSNLLDTAKAVRLMLPMTEDDLENIRPTANFSRWGICYMLLDMADDPDIEAGIVGVPTCTVIDGDESATDEYDAGYCYFTLDCGTEGANIYYNDSSDNSHMPTKLYIEDQKIKVPKQAGTAVLKVRAVKDGCVDAGVRTITSAVEEEYEEDVDPGADVWDGVSTAPAVEVDGVYTIGTCAQLKWIADRVNNIDGSGSDSFAGKTIRLANSLHLNNKPWKVIGDNKGIWASQYGSSYSDENYFFSGTFDGNGYTVSGLRPVTVTDEKSGFNGRCGLFGLANGAVIKNLTVSGLVASDAEKGIGGIAGEAAGCTFENCVNYAIVTTKPERRMAGNLRGGIAGQAAGSTFTDCVNYGDIKGTADYIGGIVGKSGTASGSRNYGAITDEYWGYAGGIVGSGSAEYCVNFGAVTGGRGGGGIAGSGSASHCTNFGAAGNGIAAEGSASRCINNGAAGSNGIVSKGSAVACVNAGSAANGLIGSGDGLARASASNSYNTGAASNAGLSGGLYTNLSNCYDANGGAALGGYSADKMTVSNIYYLNTGTEVAGNPDMDLLDVVSKTAIEMRAASFVDLLNSNAGQTLFAADTAGLNGGFPKFTWETGIIFNTNGGSAVVSQHLFPGDAGVAPEAPVRSGYVFTGWFADEALTAIYDFDTPVESEVTVYAGWQAREMAVPVEKEIVLSWTGDPETTQTVTWHDDSETGYIQYVREDNYTGESSFAGAGQVTASSSAIGYTSPKTYWQATITGLVPDTVYCYRVGSGGDWSGVYTFTTAKAGKRSFSFLYLGDIQYDANGDPETEYEEWGTMLESAYSARPEIAFGLLGGDMVNSGSSMSDWTYFLSYASNVFSGIPMMTTNGNHESNFTGGKPQFYTAILGLPENGPESFSEEFYSFDYGTVHVTVLNSWALSSEQKLSEGEVETVNGWIAADLVSAANAKFRIAVMHHPAYALQGDTVSAEVLSQWAPIFETGGVDLVFCGHQHIYARSYPMKAGAVDSGGVTYVMGNSGQKFYSNANEAYQEKIIYNKSTYQIVDINGDTLSLYTCDRNGNLLDFWSKASSIVSLTGDVDSDGDVDMDDVDAVFDAYVNCDGPDDAMDVNNDGVIDIRDAQLVLNIYLGKAS